MKNKITPGPWWVSGPNCGLQFNIQTDTSHIAIVSHIPGVMDSEAAANAKAIAAVPGLIQALQDTVGFLECNLNCDYTVAGQSQKRCAHVVQPCDCAACEVYVKARAELKKAGCE